MKVGMIGTGYVGLVAAVAFADAGHELTCVDSNEDKISTLKSGKIPFYEPGLEDLFKVNIQRLQFSTSVKDAVVNSEVVFVAVGTPELPDGGADLEPTLKAIRQVCLSANRPLKVVLKSTVPIGTAKQVQELAGKLTEYSVEIINNPEFLRQGSALKDFLNPDRIVIGCQSEQAKKVMMSLYKPFTKLGAPLLFMDNTSAEMTKYTANSFLALKISFINEMALLADKVGADIESIKNGFCSDSRINPAFFQPGIGYGGSCFPKDVRALIHTAEVHDLELKLLRAADEVNERQKKEIARRIHMHFGSLKGLTVGMWGLSFKARTDDVRRAPSISLIEELVSQGATVRAYDPVAAQNALHACKVQFEVCQTASEAAMGADALVLVTEWPEFASQDLQELKKSMRQAVIFDGRNFLEAETMSRYGFEYYGFGRQILLKKKS